MIDEIFIEKNPKVEILETALLIGRNSIIQQFDIEHVYIGYNKITMDIFSSNSEDPWQMLTGYPSIGKTSTVGFDLEEIKEILKDNLNVYFCYFAIPIDEFDCLIENPIHEDWDVENHLTERFKNQFVSIGALKVDKFERCRTIKFILTYKKNLEIENNNEAIEFLNLGISEKRAGNFEKALEYYNEAKSLSRYNENVYYNIAKVLMGLGKFDEGFKNFLTYCHLNLINPKFNNEFAKSLKDLNFIQDSYITKTNFVSSDLIIPDNIFKEEEYEKKFWQITGDLGLTEHSGCCYIAENENILEFNNISKEDIQDYQMGLLGKTCYNSTHEKGLIPLFSVIGYLYLTRNIVLYDIKDNSLLTKDKIVNQYFENFNINKNILIEKV